ncbi:coagulation factor X [Xyrichtys novacula]|uniref:coagulation factor Xa n=1 Tax=Xyrichtys novacula TaxID=13765 RepID=A0AAV1HT53_XYRNO|nr:coagulation factor X [Xyrichtys novacula]
MMWFLRLSVGLLLLHLAAVDTVFMDGKTANQVLNRRRRANSFFEEVKQGNMERECIEEQCDWEEAREIFEDKDKTDEFWAKYSDGDACESQPCAFNGICKDGLGGYTCFCQPGYRGYNCEIVVPQLCQTENGGCQHFCHIVRDYVKCSCADKYYLGSDDKSCYSNETFKCGVIITGDIRNLFRYEWGNTTKPASDLTDLNANSTHLGNDNLTSSQNSTDLLLQQTILPKEMVHEQRHTSQKATFTRIVGGEECPPGECPWQALLVNEENVGFCGGTILNEYIILTAAHCMNQTRFFTVKLGEFNVLEESDDEVVHQVETMVTHRGYRPDTYHNDIALLKLIQPIKFTRFILPACLPESDFAEEVLMKQPHGMVSGFGRIGEGRQPSPILQRLTVPFVDRHTCLESTQLTISQNMFCAGYDQEAKDACQGDSGGPHVTSYKSTYFVTGVVSWGEGCARRGKYGIYTQVSKFTRWIRYGIDRLVATKGNRRKRNTGQIERLVL